MSKSPVTKSKSYNSSQVNKNNGTSSTNGHAIISSKDLLMMSLVRFYKQNNNFYMNQIIPIIEGKCKLSLRLIDWFVTNFSKKYNTMIQNKKNDNNDYLNVYLSYRQQLKAFSKQQFDPFRRRDRIQFFYDKDNNWIETTIGQLNFFKWVLQHGILDYINDNVRSIESDMISSQKNNHENNSDVKNKPSTLSNSSSNVEKKRDSKKEKKRKIIKKTEVSKVANINPILGPKVIKFD